MKMGEETKKMASVLLEALSEYVLFMDPQMHIQWANRAAVESAGMSLEDIRGRRCYEVWHERTTICPDCPIARVFETGQPQEGEMTSPEGRHWSIRGYPVRDDQGQLLGAAEIAVDITALRQAQQALEESEAKYTALVENAQDAIVIMQDGYCRYINRTARKIYGYTLEELQEKPFIELVAPESRETVIKRAQSYFAGDRKPARLHHAAVIHKNGTRRYVESTGAVIEYQGRPALLGIFRDITNREKAEQALRESEERLRALSEGAFDGVAIHEKGIILEVNHAFDRIFGLEPGEAIGKPVLDFAAPESRETVIKNIQTGYDKPYPAVGLRKDGSKVYGEMIGRNVRYKGREARVTAIRDLSDHKKAEQALRESEERYRSVIQTCPDAITLSDLEGKLITANEQAARVHGCESVEEMLSLGKTAFDFIAPEDLERSIQNAKKTLEEESVHNIEYTLLRKDGSRFPAELSASVILDAEGQPKAFVGVVRDITERKQVEEALRESEERYRTLVQTSPDAIVLTDMNNKLVMVNQQTAKLLGYDSAEELLEKVDNVFAHIDPEFHEIAHEKFGKYDQTRGTRAAVYRLVRLDKRKVYVEVNSSVITDADGKPAGVISVIRDITDRIQAEEERRKLQEQIQHAQKLESLGILAGGIAHDFNNLLMGVLGNASLALMDLPRGSPVRHSLEQIEKTARAAADLTNQMLAYSGKGRFIVEPVDLSRLVKDMAGLLKVSISKKVDLKFDFDRDLPPVDADAAQLRQVIMNLIINASEAIGDEPGVVSVRTGTVEADSAFFAETYTHDNLPEGTYVYLEVADSGCGMDKETLGRIFDPFFTSKFTGRGLGLAAVLGIVRGHRGAVRVQSEPGQGATIRVVFPPGKAGAHPPAQEPRVKKPRKASGKILVVDDEATICDVSRRMLNNAGFEVITAKNGQEAVEIFKNQGQQIAGVLLDATMPKMDGLETFEQLRRIRKDVRVVLSSGYSEQEATQRFTGKGLTGFIQKPYRYADLVDKMNEVLGE